MYKWIIVKRKIEGVILFPFILLGRLLAFLFPLKKEYTTFYFFPFYHTGGAEKVHAQIINITASENDIIFFTRKSKNDQFLKDFSKKGANIKDISTFTDSKLLYFLNFVFRGIVTGYINKQKKRPLVFNGQSNFGYKISPWVNNDIQQIELIHAFNSFSKIRIPYIEYYRKSVTVSAEVLEKHQRLYDAYKIPKVLFQKFLYIENRIELPEKTHDYTAIKKNTFTLLYVGRGSSEKRPHILGLIAEKLEKSNLKFQIIFAGDVKENLRKFNSSNLKFLGEIKDTNLLEQVYKESQILIVPSITESGPLNFMEAMANGCVVIGTPVGYMRNHIKNGVNGFVTQNLENEEKLATEIAELVISLYNNLDLLKSIREQSIQYAFANFGLESFNESYRKLFCD